MPSALARACPTLGCPEHLPCPQHTRERQRHYNQRRGSAASRGYGARWNKARLVFLAAHPLCRACQQQGYITAATEVDHIRPHRGDSRLFWDQDNWQGLCHPCHSAKTLRGE